MTKYSQKIARKRYLDTVSGRANRREANKRYRQSKKKDHQKDCMCSMCKHRRNNPVCDCEHCLAYYRREK